jgi:cell division protein FtsL
MTRMAIVLLLLLIASGLFLVKISYDERRLFAELEKAKAEEQQLASDAKRLDAERQAQATHLRVERVARDKLGMRMATPDVTRYVADTRPVAAASGGAGASGAAGGRP